MRRRSSVHRPAAVDVERLAGDRRATGPTRRRAPPARSPPVSARWCSGFIAAISSATSSAVTPRCSAIHSKYSSRRAAPDVAGRDAVHPDPSPARAPCASTCAAVVQRPLRRGVAGEQRDRVLHRQRRDHDDRRAAGSPRPLEVRDARLRQRAACRTRSRRRARASAAGRTRRTGRASPPRRTRCSRARRGARARATVGVGEPRALLGDR